MTTVIDVVVPTVPGREASLERFEASLDRHTTHEYELNEIVVAPSRTCGWGWRRGLRYGTADYILLCSDDLELLSSSWAKVCIETVDQGLLPCPRVALADGRIESNGGDMSAARHVIPRPQRDWTEVDYTTVPFLSREQADRIGMIDVHYSSDVWVSYRGRQLGYKTVLRHGYDLLHHHELAGRGAGYTQDDRDALDEITLREELMKHENETEQV